MHRVLHAHSHFGLTEILEEKLGRFGEFLGEAVLASFVDTLKLVLFLFLTYLLMEFIEHKAEDRTRRLMERSGSFGPLVGGLFGVVPQCGFSAAAANLYTGRVITLGTLIAVFLSTSDEMIPVLISGGISARQLAIILGYKTAVGILSGFAVDGVLRLMKRNTENINIDELCDNDNCHCERGIFYSALHHTLTTGAFILITTFAINTVVFFVGTDRLSEIMVNIPVISHLIASVVGLIPNCAVSVVLSQFAVSGVISYGTMLAGLLTGAGVGVLVLFKVNKRRRENLTIILLLVVLGTLFGTLAELLPLA